MPDPPPKLQPGPDLDRTTLPLRPPAPTLAAHISALDLLAARLDALPLRESWPARVPVNSKASFVGDIVNTERVKIQLRDEGEGAGEARWVEMGAGEAAAWVRRRKAGECSQGGFGPRRWEGVAGSVLEECCHCGYDLTLAILWSSRSCAARWSRRPDSTLCRR